MDVVMKKFADPVNNKDFHELKEKLISIMEERNISFYECFQHFFPSISRRQDFLPLRDFRSSIRSLNLPINVKEERILMNIADHNNTGRYDVIIFCKMFESKKLRLMRLKDLLQRVSVMFYLHNFNL